MEAKDGPGQKGKFRYSLVFALVLFLLLGTTHLGVIAATGVRLFHLAPDVGPVEIWIDGRLIEQDLEFKEHTGYIDITPGQHRVICKTRDGPSTIVLNSPFPYRQDKDYTVALTGNRAGKDLELVYVIDNCPPTEGLAQVKFTNAVPENPPADLSIKFGPTLYSGLAFRTGGGCNLIPPDNYLFRLTETKSGSLIAEKKLELEAGTRYNIFATGLKKREGVEFLTLSKPNAPEEVPKIFGIERSVLQLFGAGIIASLLILVLGR